MKDGKKGYSNSGKGFQDPGHAEGTDKPINVGVDCHSAAAFAPLKVPTQRPDQKSKNG